MSTDTTHSTAQSGDEPGGFFGGFLAGIGAPLLFMWTEARAVARVGFLTIYYMLRRPIRWREVMNQLFNIGNQSLGFICVVLGFLGMILVFQSAYQAMRIVGDLSMLGAMFMQLLWREFAPTIVALMLATRVGTGIAAQIGSMVVTEQVDALRMNNADPIHYLVVPRFIASMVMTISLSCIGVVVCFLGGMFIAYVEFQVNPLTFFNLSVLVWGDLIVFVLKCFAYGAAVPIISAEAGLSAFGGSEGVGWATTKAVVNSSLAVTTLDFILGGVGYAFLF